MRMTLEKNGSFRALLPALPATGLGLTGVTGILLAGLAASPACAAGEDSSLFDWAAASPSYSAPPPVGLLLGNVRMGGIADSSGLGIPRLWFEALWSNTRDRRPLRGPVLKPAFAAGARTRYLQTLDMRGGILRTEATHADGAYTARLYPSLADRRLLVLHVTTTSSAPETEWSLFSPESDAAPVAGPVSTMRGQVAGLTRAAWALRANLPFRLVGGQAVFTVPAGSDLIIVLAFAVSAVGSTADPAAAAWEGLPAALDPAALEAAQDQAWQALRAGMGSFRIPEGEFSRLVRRSLFWTLATSGEAEYLPGEDQFATGAAWNMRPFAYGAAGWALRAYTALGHPSNAFAMARAYYRPAALAGNAKHFLGLLGGRPNADAWCFGHEIQTDGSEWQKQFYGRQRHLDGFLAAGFRQLAGYYPARRGFFADTGYAVLRGTAEFWRSLARPDPTGGLSLPPLLSVSEDLEKPSVLDGVLAARHTLRMAAAAAAELGRDGGSGGLAALWKAAADSLRIPQNDSLYLEYQGDDGSRLGGGYFGIRAPVYLVYPTVESAASLDPAKIDRTLDLTWERNRRGTGMIGFVANWFALADAWRGRGDQALKKASLNLRYVHGPALHEYDREKPYFLTNMASLVLVPASMLLQSRDRFIHPFPAMPAAWKDAEFRDLPAEQGWRVSGSWRGGKTEWIAFSRNGRESLRIFERRPVRINADTSLTVLGGPLATTPRKQPARRLGNLQAPARNPHLLLGRTVSPKERFHPRDQSRRDLEAAPPD